MEVNFRGVNNITSVVVYDGLLIDTIIGNHRFGSHSQTVSTSGHGLQQSGTTSTWSPKHDTHSTWFEQCVHGFQNVKVTRFITLGDPGLDLLIHFQWDVSNGDLVISIVRNTGNPQVFQTDTQTHRFVVLGIGVEHVMHSLDPKFGVEFGGIRVQTRIQLSGIFVKWDIHWATF